MARRYRFVTFLLLAAMLVLAGCGGAKSGASEQPKEAPKSEAPAPAPDRVVKHAMGESKVPANPQRIVVLDTGELDSMVALGIKPVGATTVFQDGSFQAYLQPHLEGVKQVGTISQPNLEAIAALKPDLILSSALRHKEIYDKLTQIAPTVFTERVGVTWKENFKLHAEAVNKAAEAEKIMAAYDKRMTDFRTKLGDQNGKLKISILRGLSDHVRIYMQDTFVHTVITDAGFIRPEAQDKPVFMEKATEERISDLDGDLLVYTQFRGADGADTMIVKLMQSPLWANLNAAKAGKVYEMADDHWMLGIGITAANKVIDDLETKILK